jgi:hypothetical protein
MLQRDIDERSHQVHFAILDQEDKVPDALVGLRHYSANSFVLLIDSSVFSDLSQQIDDSVENLKILVPNLEVQKFKVDLKDYWGIFFDVYNRAKEIENRTNDVKFFVNISTVNRVAAMALRDAFAATTSTAICYYFRRARGPEKGGSRVIEIPIPASLRDMEKAIPVLKALYEGGGTAESIDDLTKRVGDQMSQSENYQSQARLVEYYVKKLEVHAIVRLGGRKKREVSLTGAPMVEIPVLTR